MGLVAQENRNNNGEEEEDLNEGVPADSPAVSLSLSKCSHGLSAQVASALLTSTS